MCRRLAPPPGRQRGLVKWFSRARGYGFITPADGPEVFLHRSGFASGQPLPRAGQLVEFTLSHGARGAQAEDTVILELPGEAPDAVKAL
ncbi:MAG: cold shock domain-containing protein [Anaerolineae bacterium]